MMSRETMCEQSCVQGCVLLYLEYLIFLNSHLLMEAPIDAGLIQGDSSS